MGKKSRSRGQGRQQPVAQDAHAMQQGAELMQGQPMAQQDTIVQMQKQTHPEQASCPEPATVVVIREAAAPTHQGSLPPVYTSNDSIRPLITEDQREVQHEQSQQPQMRAVTVQYDQPQRSLPAYNNNSSMNVRHVQVTDQQSHHHHQQQQQHQMRAAAVQYEQSQSQAPLRRQSDPQPYRSAVRTVSPGADGKPRGVTFAPQVISIPIGQEEKKPAPEKITYVPPSLRFSAQASDRS